MGLALLLVLPLLFVHLRDPQPWHQPGGLRGLFAFLALALVTALLVGLHRLLPHLPNHGRLARVRRLPAAGLALAGISLLVGTFLLGLEYAGWPWVPAPDGFGFILSDVLAMLPLLAAFLVLRLENAYLIARRLGRPFQARETTLQTLRLLLVMLGPQLFYLNLLALAMESQTARLLAAHPAVAMLLGAGIFLLLVAFSPALVRLLYPAVPLVETPLGPDLQTRFDALATKAGVKLSGVTVWVTGGQRVANAAMSGILPGYRRFFVTDHLLRTLGPEELAAVLGHELGHGLLHHHAYNFLLGISTAIFVSAGLLALSFASPGFVEPGSIDSTVALLGLLMLYTVLVFSFFLRRFEFQADLASVVLLDGDSNAMIGALENLGRGTTASRRRRSLTHPSLDHRIRRLRALTDLAQAQRLLGTARRRNRLLVGVLLGLNLLAVGLMEFGTLLG
jgi:STE24 endopeptidase